MRLAGDDGDVTESGGSFLAGLAVPGFGMSATRSAAPIREESGAPTIVGHRAWRAQWIGSGGALSSARYWASSPPTSPEVLGEDGSKAQALSAASRSPSNWR